MGASPGVIHEAAAFEADESAFKIEALRLIRPHTCSRISGAASLFRTDEAGSSALIDQALLVSGCAQCMDGVVPRKAQFNRPGNHQKTGSVPASQDAPIPADP